MTVNWPSVARNAATTSVAAVAAVVSYHHQVKVASAVGEDRPVALILPLSVDGLMVVAGMAMFKDKKHWQARVAFALGIAASVTANIAAAQPTLGARLVAAWPAVALLMTVELLSRTPKVAEEPEPVVVRERQPSRPKPAKVNAGKIRQLHSQGLTQKQVARQLDTSVRTVARYWPKPELVPSLNGDAA
jgi:hypothetical protein